LQDLSPVTAHTKTLREFLQAASLFPGPLVANTRRRLAKSIDPFHFRYSRAAGPEIGQAKLQKENRNATPVSSNRLPVCRQVAENQTRGSKVTPVPGTKGSAFDSSKLAPTHTSGPCQPCQSWSISPFSFTSHLTPSQKSAAQSESSCPVNVTSHSSGTRYY
jgi:hypothetical protein